MSDFTVLFLVFEIEELRVRTFLRHVYVAISINVYGMCICVVIPIIYCTILLFSKVFNLDSKNAFATKKKYFQLKENFNNYILLLFLLNIYSI